MHPQRLKVMHQHGHLLECSIKYLKLSASLIVQSVTPRDSKSISITFFEMNSIFLYNIQTII